MAPREHWTQLGDGYRVEVEIEVRALDDALKLPVSALFRDGEHWAAFVLEGTVARKRRVELEARGTLEAVVRSGLAEGDRVIVHPDDAILDGTEVEAR